MKEYKHWSKEELKELVAMRHELEAKGNHSWEPMEIKFGVSKENVRAAYRRETGSKESSYCSSTPPTSSDQEPGYTKTEGHNFINIVCASPRMLSKEDIIREFNIDLSVWEIERFTVRTSEGYRKDRKVDWHVKNGSVITGDVEDTGKMLVTPLYHLEVKFIKKQEEALAISVIDQLLEDAKQFAPKYEKIVYPEHQEGYLYEIDIFDIHFGRLTWEDESGANFDVKLAKKAVESSMIKLLNYVKDQPVDKILLPMGNDFFNVDNKFNTTTSGTPQQEDTRWQKTYRIGREMAVWMIDMCSQIAPVDVLVIPGNHDQQRSFYLGDSLYCWYHNNPNVSIDNSAVSQKYYPFGKTLLGFTHGADVKLQKLPFIMAYDQPKLWAKSIYREWHTGDKHHKKDLVPSADEASGMTIRILRSLTAYDAWTFNSGYRSLRSSEAFLWSQSEGLVAQYTALPDLQKVGSEV